MKTVAQRRAQPHILDHAVKKDLKLKVILTSLPLPLTVKPDDMVLSTKHC